MRISFKRNLIVVAVFSSVFVLGWMLSWLFSFAADDDLEACRSNCRAENRAGRIGTVEVKNSSRPGVYQTERVCLCE